MKAESWYIASGTQGLPDSFNNDCRLTFDLFVARYLHPHTFVWEMYGENIKNSQNALKTNGWHLQYMIKVVKRFTYNQNIVLWGLSVIAPGLYTCEKLCKL